MASPTTGIDPADTARLVPLPAGARARSAARALSGRAAPRLPAARRAALEQTLREHFGVTEVYVWLAFMHMHMMCMAYACYTCTCTCTCTCACTCACACALCACARYVAASDDEGVLAYVCAYIHMHTHR